VPLPGVGRGLRDHPTVVLELGQEQGHGAPSPFWFQVMLRLWSEPSRDLPDCAIEAFHDFRLGESLAYRRSKIICTLLAAHGQGTVRLTAADPAQPPAVDLAYRDGRDLSGLGRVLGFALEVAAAPPFRRLAPRNLRLLTHCGHGAEEVPAGQRRAVAASPLGKLAEDQRAALLRDCVVTAHHLHGTCAMGHLQAADAVVDAAFRVHGTEGLHVADASVIPIQFRANTHLAAILIGERLGRLLAGARTKD
jgi:choline dehydrogenase